MIDLRIISLEDFVGFWTEDQLRRSVSGSLEMLPMLLLLPKLHRHRQLRDPHHRARAHVLSLAQLHPRPLVRMML